LYFTSVDGVFYALKADGVLKWKLRTGGVTESSPVLGADGTIYVGVNKKLWSISPEGKEQWEQEVTTDAYQQTIDATPLVLADNSLCIVSGYGLLVRFNQARVYQWTFSLQGHGHSSPTVDSSGTIYIGGHIFNEGSFFYAIAADVPLAHSPWPKFRGDLRNTGSAAEQQP
jgi:outer membrane protein assembly factor BamB